MSGQTSIKKIIAKNEILSWHLPYTPESFLDIHLEENASLSYIQEFSLDPTQEYALTLQFYLKEGSSLRYIPIITGSARCQLTINITLENYCHAHIKGVYASGNQQQYTITTRQIHTGKNATSILVMNGVASDHSLINYSGTIAIEKNASQSVASQENKTILYGPHARAISIPALEVKTNDVHCAHGSAVGPLSADHIWYAQSRGMSVIQAQKLLLRSFYSNTLDLIINQEVCAGIIERLLAKLVENKE